MQQGLVGPDDKGGPLYAEDLFAVHVLFLEHAKLIADFLVYISEERVGKVEFGAEFGLRLGRVAGDAQHHSASGLNLFELVAKPAGFNGAAGGVRAGVKEQHNRLARVVGKTDGDVFVGLQGEIGYFLIQFHGSSWVTRMVNRKVQGGVGLQYFRKEGRKALRSIGMGLPLRLAMSVCGVSAGLALALPVVAQYPGQVAKSTKDAPELRSVAVLEWTGEAGKPKACRIVPVAVLDGGKLQDGGIYMARPEPLSLAGEVEYELQQNGQVTGLFDIENSGHEQGSWVGYGTWKGKPAEKPRPTAADLAKMITDEDSDRPVLHRKKHPGDSPEAANPGGSGPEAGQPAPASDPDRPVLKKKDTGDTSGSKEDTSTASTKPDADPDRPVLHKKDSADSDSANKAAEDSDRPVLKKSKKKEPEDVGRVDSVKGLTDPDRPILKRGQPTGYKLNVAPSLMGIPPDMQQAVAVSDSRTHAEHSWSFSWANPDDERKMKAAMEEVARTALGLNPPPTPAPATTPKRVSTRKNSKPAPPVAPPEPAPLLGEKFRVFELAYSSGATMVLSAYSEEQQTEPTPEQTDGLAEKKPAQRRYVTLIAQPDFYGNLLVLRKNVTDSAHLDETPRMILVDAVDALADNRGELLFELRGATQRQFALYRVMRGRAEQLFVSSGGEFGTASE